MVFVGVWRRTTYFVHGTNVVVSVDVAADA